jgi:hypothetical protein
MKLAQAVAALGFLGAIAFSLPALAQSAANCRPEMVIGPDGRLVDQIELNKDQIALLLRQRGYDVDGVESWGGCIKAFVNEPDGSSHIGLFDPDTLQPLRN